MAQVWASRANYYVGGAYTALNQHNLALPYYKKGIIYGEKALRIQPQNQPANFWYVVSLSRSIQFTSLVNKARFLMDLLKPTWLCVKENSSYACFNILDVCGTMITNGGWVTEKGMRMAGITMENVENGLELAEMLYPDFFYTSYCRADILAYKGKKKEALAILGKLLARDPDINKQMPENHFDQREARTLYEALKQGRR